MAQKKYCPVCGKATEYANGVAPTTCGGCKKPFAAAFKVDAPAVTTPKKFTKKAISRQVDESEDEDENEEFYGEIVNLKKFEVEINIPKRMSVAQLAKGENFFNLGQNLGPSSID